MDQKLSLLLDELYRFGTTNDAAAAERSQKMLNITPEIGAFLSLMVQATRARRVLEIGTSNGYSTIWLADAVRRLGGAVTTVEIQEHKVEKARANIARAGLASLVTQHLSDAGAFLRAQGSASYDLIFLDSERTLYPGWWPDLQRVLAPGGLIICDNATSHAAEMAPFVAQVQATTGYLTSLLPLDNGELLIYKG